MDFFEPKVYFLILQFLLPLLPHCGECNPSITPSAVVASNTVVASSTMFAPSSMTLRLLKHRREGDGGGGDGEKGGEEEGGQKGSKEDDGGPNNPNDPSNLFANRFTPINLTTVIRKRTAPYRESFAEQCDYTAQYCHKTYQTGRLCARTLYFNYQTFKNYCMLDYVNCMERYEVWQVMHMGQCYELKDVTEYIHYEYQGDSFLDKDHVIDDQQWSEIG